MTYGLLRHSDWILSTLGCSIFRCWGEDKFQQVCPFNKTIHNPKSILPALSNLIHLANSGPSRGLLNKSPFFWSIMPSCTIGGCSWRMAWILPDLQADQLAECVKISLMQWSSNQFIMQKNSECVKMPLYNEVYGFADCKYKRAVSPKLSVQVCNTSSMKALLWGKFQLGGSDLY